jgi:hypothetical protein
MKTYKELQQLAKELQEKENDRIHKIISEQISKIEERIAMDLNNGINIVEWYGYLYPETILQLINSGFSVELRNPNYALVSSITQIYKSDNPVYLDKWQEDTDRIKLNRIIENKKSFWQKLFS